MDVGASVEAATEGMAVGAMAPWAIAADLAAKVAKLPTTPFVRNFP